jgi:hypothetical protein
MARIERPPRPETVSPRAADGVPVDEVEIDQTLADSFPASDPPSWTAGVAVAGEPVDDRRKAFRSIAAHVRG